MEVLVIEDENTTREMLRKMLLKEDFQVTVTASSVDGLFIADEKKIDLIILDIVLPDINGIGICQIIRNNPAKYGNPYIIMVTSKDEEIDILAGLDAGADDYVKKPFSNKELIARIKAVLRRNERKCEKEIKYNNIIIDTDKKTIFDSAGNILELFSKEYDLLVYIIKNKGIILTRENILTNVWNGERIVGDRNIDNYIWKIRKKIPCISDKLKPVRGMGYKLEKD